MLDCQWFGVSPAGHHFTNVVLHTASAKFPASASAAAAILQIRAFLLPDAITVAQKGLAIANAEGNGTLVQTLESNITLFQQHQPLRD